MSVISRFWNLFRSDALRRDLETEVRFHIESRVAANLRSGMSVTEAEADARAAFGNVARITEDMREVRVMRWLESLLQDLRYGIRSLTRDRLSTAAVIAMLALGIGANVAIFTLLNAIWLRPLPHPDADRLVTLDDAFLRLGIERVAPTVPEVLDVRRWNQSFEEMAFLDHRDLQFTGGQEPTRVFGGRVTASFFTLLGVQPALGRIFTDADNREGNERIVVLSNGLWQRAFGGDPGVIGRTIVVDGRPHEVVGVVPADFSFDYPAIGIQEPADVYVPFLMNDYYTLRSGSHSHLRRVLSLARLRPSANVQSANAELELLAKRLTSEHPELYTSRASGGDMGFTMQVRPLQQAVTGDTRTVVLLLFASVAVVLLIACANTAQFLLARSLHRQHEIAIRIALGANRRRLVQQFLAEAFTLASVSGVLGLWTAAVVVRGIQALLPTNDPLLAGARTDTTVLLFAFGLSVLTAVVFGIVPALSGSRSARELVRAGRSATQTKYALVAIEVALSLLLLAGAAVLLRGLLQISHAPRGYSADDVTVLQLRLTQPRPDLKHNASLQYEQYLEAIRQVPGVETAAVLSGQPVPLTDSNFVVGPHSGDVELLARQTARLIVSPEYFRTLRIPILEGRFFTTADSQGRPAVAIVNQEIARQLWPMESALGKQLRLPRPTTIVGVVASTRASSRMTTMTPQIYVPSLQFWEPNTNIAVRTTAGAAPPIERIKQAIWSVAPDQAIFNVRSMTDMLSRSVAEPRFRTSLLGSFAGLAVLLSTAGIYSLTSYLVTRRTREIAIRVAIGAQRRNVFWLVARQTVISTGIGVLAGIVAAVGAERAVRSVAGVAPLDAWTLAAVSVLYFAVALAATYLPARRAFTLDATRALASD